MGYITREGTQLVKDGLPFTLKTHGYPNGIQAYISPNWNNWTQVMNQALQECLLYGFNSIRTWATGPPNTHSDAVIQLWQNNPTLFFSRFDYIINQFKNNNLYLVICLGHNLAFERLAQGNLSNIYSSAYQLYKQWTTDICTRYQNEPTIAMWEVCNEYPWNIDATAIEFMNQASILIRNCDPNHLITTGYAGLQYTNSPTQFTSIHNLPDINVTSFHLYTDPEYGGNTWQHNTKTEVNYQIRKWRDLSYNLNKPIFYGEYGSDMGYIQIKGFPDPRGYNSREDNIKLIWLTEGMNEEQVHYGFHAFAGYTTQDDEALVSQLTCDPQITQTYLGHQCPQNPVTLQTFKTINQTNGEPPPPPPPNGNGNGEPPTPPTPPTVNYLLIAVPVAITAIAYLFLKK